MSLSFNLFGLRFIFLRGATAYEWQVGPFYGGIVNAMRLVHYLATVAGGLLLIVHVYLGTLGHTRTAHFKAMMTGYEDMEEEAVAEVKVSSGDARHA